MSQDDSVSNETLASIGVASVLALGLFGWALSREKSSALATVDPSITLTEHFGVTPAAYMAHSNLKNITMDAEELLSLLNERDVLPQWADEAIASARMNVTKILGYVRAEKTRA